jgi:uncharacterized protein (DUF2236 family)
VTAISPRARSCAGSIDELFVDRLSDHERERLWQEYVRFGELFDMPREVAPESHREFRAWFEGMLDSDEMHLIPNAHEIG